MIKLNWDVSGGEIWNGNTLKIPQTWDDRGFSEDLVVEMGTGIKYESLLSRTGKSSADYLTPYDNSVSVVNPT